VTVLHKRRRDGLQQERPASGGSHADWPLRRTPASRTLDQSEQIVFPSLHDSDAKKSEGNCGDDSHRSGGMVLRGLGRDRLSARKPRGFHEAAYLAEYFDTIEINTSFYPAARAEHCPPMDRARLRQSSVPVHRKAVAEISRTSRTRVTKKSGPCGRDSMCCAMPENWAPCCSVSVLFSSQRRKHRFYLKNLLKRSRIILWWWRCATPPGTTKLFYHHAARTRRRILQYRPAGDWPVR